MDNTGIRRQAGFTTRLAINISLKLLQGKHIFGICGTAQIKNNLISRVYAILAAQHVSNLLVPKIAGSEYVLTGGGSIQIVLEQNLSVTSVKGIKYDCVFSDPGRLTLTERSIILPSCVQNFEFLDEHNIQLPSIILPIKVPSPPSPPSNKRISSR